MTDGPTTAATTADGAGVRRHARIAGSLYLVIFVVAPLAFVIGPDSIRVDGDAVETARNLVQHETRFRIGMVAESIVFLVEVVLAAILYTLLRPVNRTIALAAAFARLAEAVIQAANLLTSTLALQLATDDGPLAAISGDERGALGLLLLDANDVMIFVWGLFFGLHLLLLGYLVHRSGFLPKVLGILLALAALGYLAESWGNLLAPGASDALAVVVVVLAVPGELAFTFWLLVRGVDSERWHRRALAPASI